MHKKIKVVDVTPDKPIVETVEENVEEAVEEPVEEAVEEEPPPPPPLPPPPPPPPPPKTKIAKAKTLAAPVIESETEEEEEVAPPPKKKKIPKAKSEPIVKVTTLIPCQKCGKRMTAKSLKYSQVCGNVAAKAAPKPKPKPQATPKTRAYDSDSSAHIRADEPTTYHDLIKQRVMQQREQREHHIKSLFSRAV